MGAVVRDATRRADDLVAGLLLLAQAEGAELADVRPVDLADTVGPALALVRAEAAGRGSAGAGAHRPGPDPRRPGAARAGGRQPAGERGAAQRVRRLGGRVHRGPRPGPRSCGWPPAARRSRGDRVAELFEPFRRGPVERTGAVRGSGLGLSIVRAVVTAHGGTVHAEPVPGGGLTVTVQLPATPAG